MNRPYLIAEVGVNFYDTARVEGISPLEAAKKYVSEAKRAGVDAVKFQAYKADKIASKNSPAYWDLTKEPTASQHELFRKFDKFEADDYRILSSFCSEIGIEFICTPFDFDSVDFLDPVVSVFKVSSSDLNNLPFLTHIGKKRKPVLLSVGASYISEIEEAVRTLSEAGCPDICLMHCVLSYPTKHEDANLNMIKTLKRIFPSNRIGYSDHTVPDPTMTTLTTAYLFGAEVIEKHFTLDKTLVGNDHYHAADPDDIRIAVDNFRLLAVIGGQSEKTVLDCELIPRREARRSLVLARDMRKGEVIQPSDIAIKRPGTGIEPRYFDLVVGRRVSRDLEEDTVLTWEMV